MKISRKFIIGIIGFFIVSSCQKREVHKSEKQQKIITLHNQFFQQFHKKRDSKPYYDSLLTITEHFRDEDLQYIGQISYVSIVRRNERETMRFLDSLTQTERFKKLEKINQYYTYYLLAQKLKYNYKYEKAISMAIKADSVLNEEKPKFLEQHKNANELLVGLSKPIHNYNKRVEALTEKYNELRFHNPEFYSEIARCLYNLSYFESLNKNYANAKKWIFKGLEYQNNNGYKYIGEYMDMLSDIYLIEERMDSVNWVNQRIQSLYKEGDISENQRNNFLIHNLEEQERYRSTDYLLKLQDSLFDYFGEECSHRYQLSLVLASRARVFKKEREFKKEKQTLEKQLHYVSKCGNSNKYFLDKEEETLLRLLEVDIQLSELEHINEYVERLDGIATLELAQSNSSNHVNEYLIEKQINHGQKERQMAMAMISQVKKINRLIIGITAVILIAIAVVYYWVRKNKSNQKNLENKRALLAQQKEIIKAKNQQLNFLVENLEERNEKLKDFAFSAADDIQSPLININDNIERIAVGYENIFDSDDKELIALMRTSSEQLSKMIEVLLKYSTDNKDIITNEEVDISSMLKRIRYNLSEYIVRTGTTLIIPQYVPNVTANVTLVEQVFQNLIANALKFQRPNESPQIVVGFEMKNEQFIKFFITDNGIGIPKENQQEIFKLFKKLNDKEEFEGSGIGLSTVKKIVEEFGGNVWVVSEEGKGSTFYFTLPVSNQMVEHKPEVVS